jgi:hypothetical protein
MRTSENSVKPKFNFVEIVKGEVQLLRISLPRARVNEVVRRTLRGVEQHRFACAGNTDPDY